MFKYIIKILGLELPENAEPLMEMGFYVALVCLAVLFCFINVFGYLSTLYFIQNKDFERKYPFFRMYIKYFKKSSHIFVFIEALIGFLGLIVLIYLGFSPLLR